MKQKLKQITKLIAICALLALSSCEKDLYEQPIKQSKYKMKIVNSSVLEKNSLLMNKIEKSNFFNKSGIKKNNITNRIIYDSINGYYLDTDKVKYIEGEGFNSYTFEVIKPDNTFLDNLVLISKYNGDYKPYALRYSLTDEEKSKLNTAEYIDFTNKCKASEIEESNTLEEILSKFMYHEECNMVYSWEEVINVTPCPIDGCWDPQYTGTSLGHVLVGSLICTGGGSSAADASTIATSPHGGGGGNDFNTPSNPCTKLKALFNASKSNIKPIIINDLQPDILVNPSGEKGVSIQMSAAGNYSNPIIPATTTNSYTNPLPIPSGNDCFSGIHTHPLDTYPMFSWSDMYQLYNLATHTSQHNNGMASFMLVCQDDNQVFQTYAIVFEDSGVNPVDDAINDPANAGKTINKINMEMDTKLGIEYANDNNFERAFLRFNYGYNVSLYKANSTLSNWKKLSISSNSTTANVNSTNCK